MAVSPLALEDLGSAPDLLFYGQIGTVVLTIPVPAGMTPASLNLTIGIPVYVRSASLTISQDNRLLTQVELPPAGGPLAIPSPGSGGGNAVTLLLRSFTPLDGYCLDPTNPHRLANSAVSPASSAHRPWSRTSAADPAPSWTSVGQKPTLNEPTRWSGSPPRSRRAHGGPEPGIAVLPWPTGRCPCPGWRSRTGRQIVVAGGPTPAISLYGPGPPALLITGPANELTNQTRLITGAIARYALGSRQFPDRWGPPTNAGQRTTIRRLGQPGVNASALNPRSASAWTRPGWANRCRRPGASDRVPTPAAERIGGQVVHRSAPRRSRAGPADPDGLVDRWVDIPNEMLQRILRRSTCR